MEKVMIPNRGKGKEIYEYLKIELGLPDRCKSFEVRFAVDEIVTVKCEYMPSAEDEEDV